MIASRGPEQHQHRLAFQRGEVERFSVERRAGEFDGVADERQAARRALKNAPGCRKTGIGAGGERFACFFAPDDGFRCGMIGEKIGQIIIPTESVVEVRGGKKVISPRMCYPGYVLVEMDMDDYTWHVVRSTPRVTGFVGSGQTPSPLTEEEVQNILNRATTTAETNPPAMSRPIDHGRRPTLSSIFHCRSWRSRDCRSVPREKVSSFRRVPHIPTQIQ